MKWRLFLFLALAVGVYSGCAPTATPKSECLRIYELQRQDGLSQDDAFEYYIQCKEAENA